MTPLIACIHTVHSDPRDYPNVELQALIVVLLIGGLIALRVVRPRPSDFMKVTLICTAAITVCSAFAMTWSDPLVPPALFGTVLQSSALLTVLVYASLFKRPASPTLPRASVCRRSHSVHPPAACSDARPQP